MAGSITQFAILCLTRAGEPSAIMRIPAKGALISESHETHAKWVHKNPSGRWVDGMKLLHETLDLCSSTETT